jgi:hypothetical protein
MVGAPDAAIFYKSVVQRCPAVRAVLPDETVTSVLIAEQHQIFAQNSDSLFGFGVGEL